MWGGGPEEEASGQGHSSRQSPLAVCRQPSRQREVGMVGTTQATLCPGALPSCPQTPRLGPGSCTSYMASRSLHTEFQEAQLSLSRKLFCLSVSEIPQFLRGPMACLGVFTASGSRHQGMV